MLTPAQIKNHQFSVSGRGTYAAKEVDDYINEIVASYEQMFKENGELVNKIGKLANRIEEYKSDEDNIKEALLTAQRMADKITKEAKFAAESKLSDAEETAKNTVATAKSEAEKIMNDVNEKSTVILAEAKEKAEKMVSEAVLEVDKQKLSLEKSKEEVRKFKNEVLAMYESHIEKLKKIPEEVDEELIVTIESKYTVKQQSADLENDIEAEQDFEYTELNDEELDEILASPDEEESFEDEEYEDEEQSENGFKVSFDDIDEYDRDEIEDISSNSINFSSDMGIFGDEDEDEEEEGSAFGSLFKKK